jgi:hypothetical protein
MSSVERWRSTVRRSDPRQRPTSDPSFIVVVLLVQLLRSQVGLTWRSMIIGSSRQQSSIIRQAILAMVEFQASHRRLLKSGLNENRLSVMIFACNP